MEILIADSRTLNEIQKDFSRAFPYLKLEFFDGPHKKGKPSPKSRIINNLRKVGTCRKAAPDGVITIEKTDTVARVEHDFYEKYGLTVQIFRQSGNVWIETTLTDSWTLERQNKEGCELSQNLPQEEKIDLTDRDIWE